MVRTFAIINQVIWPPVIQTLLYVFVFGVALGSRIPNVQGVSYAQFLIPGLIMMQVIDQTYGEGSSTLFQGRFMNSIQELLISPLSSSRPRALRSVPREPLPFGAMPTLLCVAEFVDKLEAVCHRCGGQRRTHCGCARPDGGDRG